MAYINEINRNQVIKNALESVESVLGGTDDLNLKSAVAIATTSVIDQVRKYVHETITKKRDELYDCTGHGTCDTVVVTANQILAALKF